MRADLASSGLYSVQMAAKMLRTPGHRVRRWIFGDPASQAGPAIANEIDRINGEYAISFASLMEARFIAEFARRGLHVRVIRRMAENARELIKKPHPFARVEFKTDGQRIMAEIVDITGEKQLYDLYKRNWAMREIMSSYLDHGMIYDDSGYVSTWEPSRDCDVVLNPKIAFGDPVLKSSKIPTRTLVDAVSIEGETYETVAKWFGVGVQDVEQAVRFEAEYPDAA